MCVGGWDFAVSRWSDNRLVDGDAREGRHCVEHFIHCWDRSVGESIIVARGRCLDTGYRTSWQVRWGVVAGIDGGHPGKVFAELVDLGAVHQWWRYCASRRSDHRGAIEDLCWEHHRWKRDGRNGSDAWLALQVHVNIVLLSKTADNEQTKQTAWSFVKSRWVGNAFVELGEILLVHSKAFVEHFDFDTTDCLVGRNRNNGARLGELGGVIEQLRKEVSHIGNGVAVHHVVGQIADLDAFKVLHLSER